jgi:hypothetical protein
LQHLSLAHYSGKAHRRRTEVRLAQCTARLHRKTGRCRADIEIWTNQLAILWEVLLPYSINPNPVPPSRLWCCALGLITELALNQPRERHLACINEQSALCFLDRTDKKKRLPWHLNLGMQRQKGIQENRRSRSIQSAKCNRCRHRASTLPLRNVAYLVDRLESVEHGYHLWDRY